MEKSSLANLIKEEVSTFDLTSGLIVLNHMVAFHVLMSSVCGWVGPGL